MPTIFHVHGVLSTFVQADAVIQAPNAPSVWGEAARQRILDRFSLIGRAEQLCAEIDQLLERKK